MLMIKRYIGESTCNILNSWERIRDSNYRSDRNCVSAICNEDEHTILHIHHEISIFSAIGRRTSRYSLDLLYDQVAVC